jgi:uncharacterized protein
MARAFSEIAFTDSVRSMQTRYGSRTAYAKLDFAEDRRDRLSENEIEFLAEHDSFYMASVGENGWPYVQHRGGPKGFLKVLNDKTIGFADFRGNKQYISVGNLRTDDRVSLFIMDYPNRQRLKLWARAKIIQAEDDSALVAKLELPGYEARVERGIILTVEAMDWNCPQHITPRYSKAEVDGLMAPLLDEIQALKTQIASAKTSQNK